ncbi:MAG: hypothetical protein B7Z58_14780 [Acidiphilium sp. 37-64-53]|nr:MAG: hypothetical protein B7Z58_14780 [Acidiphilium sp. 37-64-53]OZB28282.1 MAG: hypothetical protein B7X49_10005 [Acidiphilium sp. 34-64-41]
MHPESALAITNAAASIIMARSGLAIIECVMLDLPETKSPSTEPFCRIKRTKQCPIGEMSRI